jgi:plastocyanin
MRAITKHGAWPVLLTAAALAIAAVPVAGCGGDDDDDDEPEAAATPTTETDGGGDGGQAGGGGGGGQEPGGGGGQEPNGGGGGETLDVSLVDFRIEPPNPTVQAGTVTFNVSNDGQAPHNLEVEGPTGEAELEQDLAPGESGELTVDLSEPGTYKWYCPVGDHESLGMVGEVTVQ